MQTLSLISQDSMPAVLYSSVLTCQEGCLGLSEIHPMGGHGPRRLPTSQDQPTPPAGLFAPPSLSVSIASPARDSTAKDPPAPSILRQRDLLIFMLVCGPFRITYEHICPLLYGSRAPMSLYASRGKKAGLSHSPLHAQCPGW